MYAAQYQTYYAVHLNHHTESWGAASWNKILVTSVVDENLVQTGSTSITSSTTVSFLYPPLIQSKYYLDGVAEGHFTLYKKGTGTGWINQYSVTLLKLDEAGNYTTLASISETTGSITIATLNYLTLPIYMNISQAVVNEREKLVLRIGVTCSNGTPSIGMQVSHELYSDAKDIEISLPFAPTG